MSKILIIGAGGVANVTVHKCAQNPEATPHPAGEASTRQARQDAAQATQTLALRMALKATVYKAELQIADLDRNYYATHALTLALHPSETEERLMIRLLAFARHASDTLAFTKGISSDDEPDLWAKDLTGAIELWIELGQPDEKRVRKACGRAREVIVYCHSGHSAELWWEKHRDKLERFDNLSVINLPVAACRQLGGLAQRTLQLQCTLQDGQVWLSDAAGSVEVAPEVWKRSAGS